MENMFVQPQTSVSEKRYFGNQGTQHQGFNFGFSTNVQLTWSFLIGAWFYHDSGQFQAFEVIHWPIWVPDLRHIVLPLVPVRIITIPPQVFVWRFNHLIHFVLFPQRFTFRHAFSFILSFVLSFVFAFLLFFSFRPVSFHHSVFPLPLSFAFTICLTVGTTRDYLSEAVHWHMTHLMASIPFHPCHVCWAFVWLVFLATTLATLAFVMAHAIYVPPIVAIVCFRHVIPFCAGFILHLIHLFALRKPWKFYKKSLLMLPMSGRFRIIPITFPTGMMEAVCLDFLGKTSQQQHNQLSIQDTQPCGVYRCRQCWNKTRKLCHFKFYLPDCITDYRSCTRLRPLNCKCLSWKYGSKWQSLWPSLDRMLQRQLPQQFESVGSLTTHPQLFMTQVRHPMQVHTLTKRRNQHGCPSMRNKSCFFKIPYNRVDLFLCSDDNFCHAIVSGHRLASIISRNLLWSSFSSLYGKKNRKFVPLKQCVLSLDSGKQRMALWGLNRKSRQPSRRTSWPINRPSGGNARGVNLGWLYCLKIGCMAWLAIRSRSRMLGSLGIFDESWRWFCIEVAWAMEVLAWNYLLEENIWELSEGRFTPVGFILSTFYWALIERVGLVLCCLFSCVFVAVALVCCCFWVCGVGFLVWCFGLCFNLAHSHQ